MIYLGYASLAFANDVFLRKNPIINTYIEEFEYHKSDGSLRDVK